MKFNQIALSCTLLIILALASCNTKQSPTNEGGEAMISGKETYADSSSSFVRVFDKDGKLFIQKTNTDYELVEAVSNKEKHQLLLKITKAELSNADSVNSSKIYTIVTRDITHSSISDASYEINFKANELEFKDNTILATRSGSNTEEDYISRYNLFSGAKVFDCSYGSLNVGIPNVKDKRFIGYTSRAATGNPLKQSIEGNLMAVINYSSSEKAISSFKLKLKRSPIADKLPAYTPEMLWVSTNGKNAVVDDGKVLILMGADEKYTAKDVSGFSAVFTFFIGEDNETTKIVIPVIDDKLALSKATFDKDLFELSE
jgi:hypothetical protein